VRPIAGGAASPWVTSPAGSFRSFAADPAEGSLLAYTTSTSPPDLVIGNQAASSATTVASRPSLVDPNWSPNGSQIVVYDSSSGLWLYTASGGGTGRELLVDPNPSTLFPTFGQPVFVGPGEIAFDANNNIYEIPTSCNMCTFPGPQVHQLTTDGTASSPDGYPAWTSQTITEFGQGHTTPPPPPTKFKLTVKALSSQKVLKQKGLVETVQCKVTLKLSKSELKTIMRALAHHKRVTAQVGAAARDAAGTRTQQSRTFRIKH
jgi:hypothetical protein